jgi:hypothetical protein
MFLNETFKKEKGVYIALIVFALLNQNILLNLFCVQC